MSRYLYPYERRRRRRRRLMIASALLAAVILLWLLDRSLYHAALTSDLPRLEGKDWYRSFRIVGTLWPWLLICTALILQGLAVKREGREGGAWGEWGIGGSRLVAAGTLILVSALCSGLIAEILQVLTGRLRPNQTDGRHEFRGLIERFVNSDNLGFPSSHAAVAFGAAFMVWFFFPGPGVIALLAALLCGWTRMLAGAHFSTDIFGAALLGYAMARILRPGSWRGESQGSLLYT